MGKFIQGFLGDRTFEVAVGGSLSSTKVEKNGVPQGAVLAVTLFLVAINDVFDILPAGIYPLVYADDIVLVVTGKSTYRIRKKLQASIRAIDKWASSVGFQLSLEKCCFSHICMKSHHPWRRAITIRDTELAYRKNIKILGITMDRKFNFEAHFKILKNEVKTRSKLIKIISRRHQRGNRRTLLQVGNSIVTSKLLYGIELTSRNFDSINNMLGPSYHGMIRHCSGLLPSTPAASACIEAAALPFHATIAVAIVRSAVGFLGKTTGHSDPTAVSVQPVIQRFPNISAPTTLQVCRVWDREWHSQVPTIDWSVKKAYNVGEPPEKAKAIFNHLLQTKYQNYKVIFTDGSKNDDRVGIGITTNICNYFYRLPKIYSVFSAEAAAIHTAISIIDECNEKPRVVFTDSASVLSAIESGKSRHPWVQAIEDCLGDTVLCWVPGHVGITGNEEADQLACLGRRGRLLTREVPGVDIIRGVKNDIAISVTTEWRQNRSLFLGKVKGDFVRWEDRSDRKEQIILSRLRTGHTLLTHGSLFEGKGRSICETCSVNLTVEHVLIDCPEYHMVRETYLQGSSVRDILSNDRTREEQVFCFLKDANLLDKI